MTLLLASGMVILGLLALWKGADWLVDGASSIAKALGISAIVVGLTIVAFGTSLPELIVSFRAALAGQGDIAYGNILGSNIANVFFILGAAAFLRALPVMRNTVRIEIPFAIAAALLMYFFSPDGVISRLDGLILLGLFIVFFTYTILSAKSGVKKCNTALCKLREKKKRQKLFTGKTMGKSIFFIILGLILLGFGAELTVTGAKQIATLFGLSDLLIGLTIVAVGTSLPELITSLVGALKGETDIVVGNIVGSNIFNTFWILSITSLISPIQIANPSRLKPDLWFNVLTFSLVFFMIMIWRQKDNPKKAYQISRLEGFILLCFYLIYMYMIISRELVGLT